MIVIGASNRQDLIDPAVLRPGRLDLKVKVHRPEKAGALQIFTKYLTTDLPFSQDATRKYGPEPKEIVRGILSETVESMYAENEENKFLEVTYAKGEREIFYFKHFSSGAMLKNIVDRAKKKAVKRAITSDDEGVRLSDMLESVREEFKENEDLPNTTNPDDWARISGRKGERIINVRTLITGMSRTEHQIENVGGSGQYLCMPLPCVFGSEIEYGITVQGDPDFDPISSCVLLVNAYQDNEDARILWDYEQENPLADAQTGATRIPCSP